MAATQSKPKHWSGSGQLRGGRRGIWFFITALRLLGLRVTYLLAVPPAIYFSFASPDVAATMDFHRRIFRSVAGVEASLVRVQTFSLFRPGFD